MKKKGKENVRNEICDPICQPLQFFWLKISARIDENKYQPLVPSCFRNLLFSVFSIDNYSCIETKICSVLCTQTRTSYTSTSRRKLPGFNPISLQAIKSSLVRVDGTTCYGFTFYIGNTCTRTTWTLEPLVTGLVVPLGPLMQGLLETPGLTVAGHLVHGQVKVVPLSLP